MKDGDEARFPEICGTIPFFFKHTSRQEGRREAASEWLKWVALLILLKGRAGPPAWRQVLLNPDCRETATLLTWDLANLSWGTDT